MITMQHLSKHFGQRRAGDDLSFEVEPGTLGRVVHDVVSATRAAGVAIAVALSRIQNAAVFTIYVGLALGIGIGLLKRRDVD